MKSSEEATTQALNPPVAAPQSWLDEVRALYPALADVHPGLASVLPVEGPLRVPTGAILFSEGQPCPGFPLLIDGEVRITRRAADGRSLELYVVGPGDLCLVSSACLFQGQSMTGEAAAIRPTRLLLVPPAVFEQWLACPPFRSFVMGLFAQRLADLAALIEAVAFQRLDQRLAAALLGHGPELSVTHQELAAGWGRCVRSSRGCCAASSATAGSRWDGNTSASLIARRCAPALGDE